MSRTEEEQFNLEELDIRDYPTVCDTCGEPHMYYYHPGDECTDCGGTLISRYCLDD